MSANPSTPVQNTEDSFPNYPGFGDPDDVLARINLLEWIWEQIGNGSVQVKVGDYVLATDGRILGTGEDDEELWRRIVAAEPSLANARVVGYRVPFSEF
jgi:hypothetical protein